MRCWERFREKSSKSSIYANPKFEMILTKEALSCWYLIGFRKIKLSFVSTDMPFYPVLGSQLQGNIIILPSSIWFVYILCFPGQKLSWRVTWASISADVSQWYKYKGRPMHPLCSIKPKIICLKDSKSLLLRKKSLGQGEREAHKSLRLQIKQVLPFNTKGNEYIWKEHKKIPTFHWHTYSCHAPMWKDTVYPTKDQEGLCLLALFLRQMYKWHLGSDVRNPLKFDLSPGPVACCAELPWVGPSCWCPHWWLHVFRECSVIQPGSLLTARTFQAPFLLLGSLTY